MEFTPAKLARIACVTAALLIVAPWTMSALGIFSFTTQAATFVSNDLDGDGKADLLVRNTTSGDLSGWLMNGLSIAQTELSPGLSSQWSIAGIGDLTGRQADLVVRDTTNCRIFAWFMNGLAVKQMLPLGPYTQLCAIGVSGTSTATAIAIWCFATPRQETWSCGS
jgi:hypothetical protein